MYEKYLEIVHKPGAGKIVDYLSRHPLYELVLPISQEAARYVAFVSNHSLSNAIQREEFVEETYKDIKLSKMKCLLIGSRLSDSKMREEVNEFHRVWDELKITDDGLVMRNRELVVPSSLQKTIISLAHDGHQSMIKTKRLLRTKL